MNSLKELHKALGEHHARLSKIHADHSEACDDDSVEKVVHAQLADEHKRMAKLHKTASEFDGAILPEPEAVTWAGRGGDGGYPGKASFASRQSDVDRLPGEFRKLVVGG